MEALALRYHLALTHTWLSSAVLTRLVKAFGSAPLVWEASEARLAEHLKRDKRDSLGKFLTARDNIDLDSIMTLYEAAHIDVIPQGADRYPALLAQTADPPFTLFVKGSPTLLLPRPLAVVGTRHYTDYGQKALYRIIEQLAPIQACIVSGLAAGIDTLAHQRALAHKMPTIAVFGTAIDQVYPRQNQGLIQQILATGGAVISEYPIGMPSDKFMFPQRNRIIAGLAEGTLVVEGDVKSGSLITARLALEENRQVMAIPGSLFNPMSAGPNRLIQSGAKLVQHADDILDALSWSTHPRLAPVNDPQIAETVSNMIAALTPLEREVLVTVGYEPTSLDTIQSQKIHLSITQLNTTLTMLELQGLVRPLPGAKFCRS